MKIKCVAKLRGVRIEETIEVPEIPEYTDEEMKESAYVEWEADAFESDWEDVQD